MGLLKSVFIILLFFFTTGEIFRFQAGDNITISLIDILVGFTISLWLVRFLIQKKQSNIQKSNLIKPISIFIGIEVISLFIGSGKLNQNELTISFLYLLRWAFYAGIYFVVKDFDLKFKEKILKLMVIAGVIMLAGGYLQLLLYSNLRNLYYLGWDDHLYRMFSSLFDPNFAGLLFALFFLLLSGLFLSSLKNRDKRVSFLVGVLAIIALIAVFLTYSRSALLMLIFGFSVLLTMINKKKLIIVFMTILILTILISSRNFYIENMNLFRTASSVARVKSSQDALMIIKDNFLFGVGFNAYRYAQVRYGFRSQIGARTSHADAGTDNSFLFVLATTGVVGFICYLYLWLKIIATGLRQYRKGKGFEKILGIIFISSVAGIFVGSMFVNALFFPPIMLWLWILVGLMENK